MAEGKEKKERIQWHPAYLGAMELELRDSRSILKFEAEHSLSKKPLSIDLLVVKMDRRGRVSNQIGEIFRGHNIVEFKSPDDALNIDKLYKTLGYAFLYKGLGKKTNQIPAEELTVTIIRARRPKRLFKVMDDMGVGVHLRHRGIYDLRGLVMHPVQIVVARELDEKLHPTLRVLTRNARKKDVKRFLKDAVGCKGAGDRENVDAVLQASVSANRELYRRLRKEDEMCEALMELMKEDVDRLRRDDLLALEQAKREIGQMKQEADQAKREIGQMRQEADQAKRETEGAVLAAIRGVMDAFGCGAEEAMETMRVPRERRAGYLTML